MGEKKNTSEEIRHDSSNINGDSERKAQFFCRIIKYITLRHYANDWETCWK